MDFTTPALLPTACCPVTLRCLNLSVERWRLTQPQWPSRTQTVWHRLVQTDESCGSDLVGRAAVRLQMKARGSLVLVFEPSCPFQSQELIGPVLQLVSLFSASIPVLMMFIGSFVLIISSRGLRHNVFKPYSDRVRLNKVFYLRPTCRCSGQRALVCFSFVFFCTWMVRWEAAFRTEDGTLRFKCVCVCVSFIYL